MASNPEYLRIVALTKDLQLSVRDQLTSLSLALVSKLLISPDAGSDLRNPMHSGADRAAKLVELLQRKVLEDAKHYHTFIRVLEEDGSEYHRVILGKLRQLTPTKKGICHDTLAVGFASYCYLSLTLSSAGLTALLEILE